MNIKILIVDDECEILESLKNALEFEAFEVDTAKSVTEALKLIDKNYYAIILTDIAMPGETGLDLLKVVKQKNPLCNVIMMTGQSTFDRVVDAISAGACDYLLKPLIDMELTINILKITAERVKRWRKLFKK